jgi:diaminohydroxyphosphoribosylaminopyrimidine deaminase/5-amino-6-(5-phosphoribosylamino)uracil reductase
MIDSNDEKCMRRAIELARRGEGLTRPNPCVGAVLRSPSGEFLGEGWHRGPGLPHAEIEALRDAAARGHSAAGGTMIVTLEPCNHHGRTGPCSEALLAAGVMRVVFGSSDPNPKATGGGAKLASSGVEVIGGVLAAECDALNRGFLTSHRVGRPFVTLKWAMTLDGCTGLPNGESKWITGEEARREVHRRRALHDVVLAGIGTVLRDEARLTVRDRSISMAGSRARVVLDRTLRLPPNAPILRESDGSAVLVFCSDRAGLEREGALRQAGAEVVRLGELSVQDALAELHRRGFQSVTVEGGRTVAGAFVAAQAFDAVECWIAPRLAGGTLGAHLGPTTSVNPLQLMSESFPVEQLRLSIFGSDWLLEGLRGKDPRRGQQLGGSVEHASH